MRLLSRILMLPIRFYRYFISPFTNQSCRYAPTCSSYALKALEKHGGFWGSVMAIKRILSCHPFGACGHDPVPDTVPIIQNILKKKRMKNDAEKPE